MSIQVRSLMTRVMVSAIVGLAVTFLSDPAFAAIGDVLRTVTLPSGVTCLSAASKSQQPADAGSTILRGSHYHLELFRENEMVRLHPSQLLPRQFGMARHQSKRLVEVVGDTSGHLAYNAQLLRASQQFAALFRLFAIGYVPDHSEQLHSPAVPVTYDPTAGRQPAHRAAGPTSPKFENQVTRTVAQDSCKLLQHPMPVRRVNVRQHTGPANIDVFMADVEQCCRLRRAVEAVGTQVPIPRSHTASLERHTESFLACRTLGCSGFRGRSGDLLPG